MAKRKEEEEQVEKEEMKISSNIPTRKTNLRKLTIQIGKEGKEGGGGGNENVNYHPYSQNDLPK